MWSHHKQDIHPSPSLALLSTATLLILISASTCPLSQIYPSVSLCHVLMLILDLDRCPPETLLCIITHLTQIYAFFQNLNMFVMYRSPQCYTVVVTLQWLYWSHNLRFYGKVSKCRASPWCVCFSVSLFSSLHTAFYESPPFKKKEKKRNVWRKCKIWQYGPWAAE